MRAGPSVVDVGAELIDGLLELSVVGSFSRVGYRVRRHIFGWRDLAPGALAGHVALVTGAASGLGRATVSGLAGAGATVILLGRDAGRTAQARDELARESGNDDLHVLVTDLSRLDAVRAAADDVLATWERLDVLIHNAGTLVHELERTADGIEVTAQVHVVAPFLLTARLLPLLERTRSSRVITVVSGGMYTARLDVAALGARPGGRSPAGDEFDGVKAYAMAKRAQVVLNEQWARRAARRGIEFQAMHPGWADTAGLQSSLPTFHRFLGPVLRSPEQGVDTTLWLAADEQSRESGRLWLDRHPRRTTHFPGTSTPEGEADRLWSWCCAHAGIDEDALLAEPHPANRAVPSDEVAP